MSGVSIVRFEGKIRAVLESVEGIKKELRRLADAIEGKNNRGGERD